MLNTFLQNVSSAKPAPPIDHSDAITYIYQNETKSIGQFSLESIHVA